MRFWLTRMPVIFICLALAWMSIPAWAQPARRGGVLRVAQVGEPPTLDQHWTTSTIVWHTMSHVNESLFEFDGKFQPKPMLVDKWTMSADRLTYTFTLRKGVKFHNGKDLTSDDVRASLERWGRIATRGRVLFANLAQIVTPDPTTVVLRLREPYGMLLLDLALPMQGAVIFPREVIDEAEAGPIRRFIGTGPYRFVEHLPDRHVRFDRYDGYAARAEEPDGAAGRKHAYFDSIYFIPVPDPPVRIAGVVRGDFHYARSIPTDEHSRLRGQREVVPLVDSLPGWQALIFNHRAGLMTNRKIRQAFQAALDHGAVMRAAYGPQRFWRLDPGLVVKEHYMWTDAGKDLYNQRNPSRARELLREAGYRGEPVRLLTSMEFPAGGIASQVAKGQLEQAGFVVDLQMVDWATVLARRARPDLWDVFSTAMPFVFTVDPTMLLPLQPTWPGWYGNRDMVAMMTLLRRHSDPRVRIEIWKRMQRLWYEDAASIKFGDFFDLSLIRREIRGFVDTPFPVFWNAWFEGR